jgi:hypothetical protein
MFRRIVLALISGSMMLSPVFVHACGDGMDMSYGDGGIIQTPVSAKGRFIFVTKISRRQLREAVALSQQMYRPRTLVRAEI